MKAARELLEKYRQGKCDPEEKLLLSKWYHLLGEDEPSELTEKDLEAAKNRFRQRMNVATSSSRTIALWPRMAAAVVLLILFSAGLYLFYNTRTKPVEVGTMPQSSPFDVEPGGNRAILMLSDGTRIVLDTARKGVLAAQGGITIRKKADGQVVYDLDQKTAENGKLEFNTIETPRGGQYQVNLPDGTRVWLNAASLLRFPAVFAADERTVEVKGEAYFEVVRNEKKPFMVVSEGQTIEVLGTHFNINAYQDEGLMKTTLLEGSVKIRTHRHQRLLRPGDQARVERNGNDPISIVNADTEEVVAWKNGYFQFNNTDLPSLMRQLSRWYGVEIIYEGPVGNETFVGEIGRDATLSKVLKILEFAGVRFRIEGKKLIVIS